MMPTTAPSTIEVMIANTATRIVFRTPFRNASHTGWLESNGSNTSPISKLAAPFKKSKPLRMLRSAKLLETFCTNSHTKATSTARTTN